MQGLRFTIQTINGRQLPLFRAEADQGSRSSVVAALRWSSEVGVASFRFRGSDVGLDVGFWV